MGPHCVAQVGFELSMSLPLPVDNWTCRYAWSHQMPLLLSLRVSNYNMELRDMLQKVGVLQKSLML